MLDAHAAQKVAGSDMEGVGILVGALLGLVTRAADETVALHYHIDVGGNEQFHSTQEGVDVDLLVLADGCLAQIQPQAAAEGVQPGSAERFTPEDVTIGTKIDRTMHALAVFAQRQGALQPLRWVVAEVVYQQFNTYIEQQHGTEILRPRVCPIKMNDAPHVCQLEQSSHDENDSDNFSPVHNFSFYAVQRTAIFVF